MSVNGSFVKRDCDFFIRLSHEIYNHFVSNRKINISVQKKEDGTPVTEMDIFLDKKIRSYLNNFFPDDEVRSEELDIYNGKNDFSWIVDPIDGTKSFVAGVPMYGTLVGLLKNGNPIIGMILLLDKGKAYIGDFFQSFSYNLSSKQVILLQAKKTTHLSEMIICSTDIVNVKKYHSFIRFWMLLESVQTFRTWGDCYGYTLLLDNHIDAMLDPILSPWDKLPLIPLLRGAGFCVTDWYGKPNLESSSLIVAHPYVHKKIFSFLFE